MSYEAPYEGVKVVDLSQGIAGPYCGMLLAQQGANVIKVEPTGGGDWSRGLGTAYGDVTAYTIAGNLGKKSIALDLKDEAGRTVLWDLVAEADVLMEGFRPGVMARLGFDYKAVAKRNPGVIYLSVSGFGQQGPLAAHPALDPALQALTGMMDSNKGEDGVPHRIVFIPVDMATALYSFHAVSAALYAKRDDPRGRHIDSSLMRAGAAIQSIRVMANTLEGGEMMPGSLPHGVYPTKDGWITLVVQKNELFAAFCQAIGRPDMAEDPRYTDLARRAANVAALNDDVSAAMAQETSVTMSARLTEADITNEILNDYAGFLAHPQAKADETVTWIDHPKIPTPVPMPLAAGAPPPISGTPRGTTPALGQHTSAILEAHGYSAERIAELAGKGVIEGPGLAPTNAAAD